MQAINEKIISLDYNEVRAEIKTIDAQELLNGVIVLVTGYLTGNDNVRRNFTQSFFLAPQDKGYFVLNDMFRYMEDVEHQMDKQGLANGTVTPLTPEHEPAPVQEHIVSEQAASLSEEEINVKEVCNHSDNEDGSIVEEVPIVEVVNGTQNDAQMVADSSSTALEEVPKKSYASIVRNCHWVQVKVKKESAATLSVPVRAPSPAKPSPVNPERQVAPPPARVASPTEITSSNLNATESGNVHEAEADGHSIYIRGLPLNAMPAQLEEEFRRFGPIKSDGVQVRSNKQQGFCYGFVEFEAATAVQSAIEASPIMIGGRQAYVEEKRASSSRVNNRGRFPSGRGGGFRNDGARGRGNYGNARNYSRGDFNNRADFVNRGPSRGVFARGGDGGYQRFDNVGSSGGRMNRASGFTAVNAMAKSITPRVSAPA
ncbi:nuclear transport factor 2 isoform X1 [Magnolia sinica]|uniref:nuclear transport factor 2 isoform X1 n=1 Tax=Magnolia sinica TaxID=86752 RepID=UPI00265B3670|nr:nuclear transport factor 2 isoform X1 [Magnolia sinica]